MNQLKSMQYLICLLLINYHSVLTCALINLIYVRGGNVIKRFLTHCLVLLQVLRLIIWQCLTVATDKNYKSVAFPAFGTGRLEYPPRKVAETMFDVVQKFAMKNPNTTVKQVYIVLFGKDTENIVVNINDIGNA